jgi:hypothetical protein
MSSRSNGVMKLVLSLSSVRWVNRSPSCSSSLSFSTPARTDVRSPANSRKRQTPLTMLAEAWSKRVMKSSVLGRNQRTSYPRRPAGMPGVYADHPVGEAVVEQAEGLGYAFRRMS